MPTCETKSWMFACDGKQVVFHDLLAALKASPCRGYILAMYGENRLLTQFDQVSGSSEKQVMFSSIKALLQPRAAKMARPLCH